MKFQKVEISFLIFGSILVVVFNVILVALKVLVVFEIFKETSNKFAVKFLSSMTVSLKRLDYSGADIITYSSKEIQWVRAIVTIHSLFLTLIRNFQVTPFTK